MLGYLRIRALWRWRTHDLGQAMVEYGLILALVVIVGVTGVSALGGSTGALYETIKAAADAMGDALAG